MDRSQFAVGHLALYPPWGGGVSLPMLGGSAFDLGRDFSPRVPSTGRVGATAADPRVRRPALLVRTRAYADFFNARTLAQLFLKDRGTGQLGSLGSIQVRMGAGESFCFTDCKADSFLLKWAESGGALEITMRLLPYGRRRSPRAVPAVRAYGPAYAGRGVTYGGGVNAVAMGWLRVDNRLRANLSEPRAVGIDGSEIPLDYYSDFYGVSGALAVYTGGVPLPAGGGDLRVNFVSDDLATGVAVKAFGLPPNRSIAHTAPSDPALETRSFAALQPDTARDALRFLQL